MITQKMRTPKIITYHLRYLPIIKHKFKISAKTHLQCFSQIPSHFGFYPFVSPNLTTQTLPHFPNGSIDLIPYSLFCHFVHCSHSFRRLDPCSVDHHHPPSWTLTRRQKTQNSLQFIGFITALESEWSAECCQSRRSAVRLEARETQRTVWGWERDERGNIKNKRFG